MAFTNNTHKSMVTAFTDAGKELLKNPYYYFNNSKATIVEYYNINIEQSTLDDSTKLAYSRFGTESPLRFNLIHDFFLYGIDKIQLELENEENGLSSSEITGEALILPNTIKPYPGDFFTITHLDSKVLFEVSSVNKDTLEDGANFWRINYRISRFLDKEAEKKLDDSTITEFEFDVTTVGTGYKSVVKKVDADIVQLLEEVNSTLRTYFKDLFYSEKVQTFIYPYDSVQHSYIYDSMLIEFIIRNNIMKADGNKYMYIEHKLPIPATFSVDYAQTIFRALETKDLENLRSYKYIGIGKYIDNSMSIFSTRPHNYFSIDYNLYNQMYHTLDERMKDKKEEIEEDIKTIGGITYTRPVNVTRTTTHGDIICNLVSGDVSSNASSFNPLIQDPVIPNHISKDLPPLLALKSEVLDAIVNNELYDVGPYQQYNILIKYFNNKDIDADTIHTIENIMYSTYNNDLYFLIPMIIYCIDQNINKIMK